MIKYELDDKKEKKERGISLRMTLKNFYEIKRRAMLYCGGNITEYVTYAARHFSPINCDVERGPLGQIPVGFRNNKRKKRKKD